MSRVSPRRSNRLGLPVLIALTVAPALVIGAGLWFLADMVPQCTPDMRQSIASPDGTRTLVVFGLDCGTTTGFNTQAAIHPSSETFNAETAETFYSAQGRFDPQVRWTGPAAIEITTPPETEIYRQEKTIGPVTVAYR
jgi:hypothetical protein